MKELQARIIEYSKIDSVSGCWEWQKSKFPNGYGQTKVERKGTGAHRASWIAFNGPIPEGMQVCHKCDNPGCVNPDHLFVGTGLENIQDSTRKGRRFKPFGVLQGAHKLTEDMVQHIKSLPKPVTMKQAKELGKQFSINPFHVYRIRSGKRWSHLTGQ